MAPDQTLDLQFDEFEPLNIGNHGQDGLGRLPPGFRLNNNPK